MNTIHTPDNKLSIPVIDAHAHVFPDKIAERAIESISDYYGLQMAGTGKVDDLNARCVMAGISHVLICSTATHPGQAISINAFINEAYEENRLARRRNPSLPQYIPFGTSYPGDDPEAIRGDVEQVLSLGLAGIKLHPDFQQIAADSSGAFTLCRILDVRLPILIHAGDHRTTTSSPERISRLAGAYPNQTFIAAHFGGWSVWSHVLKNLAGLPNVYIDTSSSLMLMSATDAIQLIKGMGVGRVLFGTDYPAEDPSEELDRFLALPLSDEEKRAILYENARQLLNL